VAVGQIWLDRADAAQTLERLAGFDFVRSVRQKPRANASASDGTPGGMTERGWREGFAQLRPRGLRFDLQTPWWHLPEAAALARDFSDTQIIINHTGLPADRSADGLSAWRAAMAVVAECPNVAVKISGIGVPGQAWTADANREVVMTTIALFGIERCMFASNFPVDSLCASFDDIFDGFEAITSGFSPDERARLFHDNAVRMYAVPPAWLHAEAKDPLIPAKAGIQGRIRRSE
jgi:predicted TIM-barrel fold metal-dependent hydrolase